MGQEGWRKIRGGLEKNHNKEGGGLPKFFSLIRVGFEKINLFHQIILVKETNIVEPCTLYSCELRPFKM